MMEQNYKFIIRLLLGTNVLCVVIILLLCREIVLLQDKLSEVMELVQTLNDKISKLEAIQQEAINGEKCIEKGNVYILGITVFVLGACAVIYLGGIDPGDLGNTLNLLADQSNKDITSQNVLINENLKHCLRGIEGLNRNLLTEITTRTDHICAKLNVVLNSMITKDANLNSILGNRPSGRSGWE